MISNVTITGLEESMKAHQYSYKTNIDDVGDKWDVFKKCATAPIGSGHNNALKGINVQMNVTFTNKVWVEAERYHWFDIVMSQSTMHSILKFDLKHQYIEYVDYTMIHRMEEMVEEYNTIDSWWTINDENIYGTKADYLKDLYLRILYSNPCGFKLTARITTNYLQLRTMYHQRKNHRLPEWKEFCAWIDTLPHSDLITEVNK